MEDKDTLRQPKNFSHPELVDKTNDNHRSTTKDVSLDEDLKDVPAQIRSLIGIGAGITEEDIASDERLAYILSK